MRSTVAGGDGDIEQQTDSCSYESAIEALSTMTYDRRKATPSFRAARLKLMSEYLKVLGLEEKIDELKIIHVAGTKGKGSTCTFSEAILRRCGFRTGLFTSPHLIDVRERFRINGLVISQGNFLHHFWDCWHQIKEKTADGLLMPLINQFFILLGFKIFLAEKVDVVILEAGLGGGLDATNVVKTPIVCGITSLGMDHMEILGDTLEKIASEKAGIFKSGVPAYTVPQLSEAMSVLQDRAATLMIPLNIAPPLQPKMLSGLKLGLDGLHQFTNASLAVALCTCWLEQTKNQVLYTNDNMDACLPEPFLQGLCTANIGGRAQIVHDKLEKSSQMLDMDENYSNLVFYLDAAHTPESMEICATWFSDSVNEEQISPKVNIMDEFYPINDVMHENKCNQNGPNKISKRILIFNCMDVRDPQLLFPPFIKTCARKGVNFSKVFFVHTTFTLQSVDPPVSVDALDNSTDISWQSTLQRTWEKIIHGEDVPENDSQLEKRYNLPSYDFLHENRENCNPMANNFTCTAVSPSLPLTIKWLRDCAKENPSFQLQVLVTGSVRLVGDVLKLLGR